MNNQECKKCHKLKSLNNFSIDKSRLSGRHPYCKECKRLDGIRRRREIGIMSVQEKHYMLSRRLFKICNRCKTNKQLADFGTSKKSPDGSKYTCRACECKINKQRLLDGKINWKKANNKKKNKRRELKLKIIIMFGGKCITCGIKPSDVLPVYCFDFHHPDGSVKEYTISHMINSGKYTMEQILIEAKKCSVMCAICHRIETFKEKEQK